MAEIIKFPKDNGQRYYKIHYQYVRDIFDISGYQIVEADGLDISKTSFRCLFENKEIIFDFSDNGEDIVRNSEIPVFKFHYREEHNGLKKIFPFAPVSFYFRQWVKMKRYHEEIKYTAKGEKILNNQRVYGNAVMRRNIVRGILQQNFATAVEFNIIDQEEYFKKINDALVHVFVPGQNNHMIDRGQLQFFALGCCTISPNLPELLPFGKTIIPYKHYIPMKDDYSDLTLQINEAKQNRKGCLKVGNQAKDLFNETCTPEKLIKWIKLCL